MLALQAGKQVAGVINLALDVTLENLDTSCGLFQLAQISLEDYHVATQLLWLRIRNSGLDGHSSHGVERGLALLGQVGLDSIQKLALPESGLNALPLAVTTVTTVGLAGELLQRRDVSTSQEVTLLVCGLVQAGEAQEDLKGVRVALKSWDWAAGKLGREPRVDVGPVAGSGGGEARD